MPLSRTAGEGSLNIGELGGRPPDFDAQVESGTGGQADQRVQAELADPAPQEVIQAGLGYRLTLGGFGLSKIPGRYDLLNGNHQVGTNFHVGRLGTRGLGDVPDGLENLIGTHLALRTKSGSREAAKSPPRFADRC